MIFNYIHRLKNRLYDSGGKKRKDRNNDDLQSQGLKLEQSYLKAEAECSKKKLHPDKHPSATETKKAELTNSFHRAKRVGFVEQGH